MIVENLEYFGDSYLKSNFSLLTLVVKSELKDDFVLMPSFKNSILDYRIKKIDYGREIIIPRHKKRIFYQVIMKLLKDIFKSNSGHNISLKKLKAEYQKRDPQRQVLEQRLKMVHKMPKRRVLEALTREGTICTSIFLNKVVDILKH
jgi:hypothetical protein